MEAYLFVALFYILVLVFFYQDRKKTQLQINGFDQRYLLWCHLALLLGVVARTTYLSYPNDINCDEAMAAYDAWCLANFQVDQHLMSFPVYFKSWGSGQSVLYSYLLIPLVKLFGMNSTTEIRIPMAIISSITLFVVYYTLRKIKFDSLLIFLTVLFLVFNPWHITKSRWALDCNLAPDLIFIGICFIALAYHNSHYYKQTILYFIAFVSLSLAAYSYAVVWFMLPFFYLLTIILLYRKKRINGKQVAICLFTSLIIVVPLILFAYNIIVKGDTMSFGIFSIPKLTESRHESGTIANMDSEGVIFYFSAVLKRLFYGYDLLTWNSAPYSGQFYNPIGWVFIIIGFLYFFKNKSKNILETLLFLSLLSSIPIILTVEYNVNRWNVLWFPLSFFCTIGIYNCVRNSKVAQRVFYVIFSLCVLFFSYQYIEVTHKYFNKEMGEHIQFVTDMDVDTIHYAEVNAEHSIIYFYAPISPYQLMKTQVPIDRTSNMTRYHAFGKYIVNVPSQLEPKKKTAYIVSNADLKKDNPNYVEVNYSEFNVKKGKIFTTFWNE